jgi:DNA-3-methyladenine glycosylase I
LCLTYFENGLSWATVYRKRDAFRRAFHNFDPVAVAALTDRDANRLLADRSIIRHRGKIEASIHNARLVEPDRRCLIWYGLMLRAFSRCWSAGRMGG